MGVDHTAYLPHTQVCWFSKRNILPHVFELRKEVKLFVIAKKDILFLFSEPWFSTHFFINLAVFKVLNQLNKKLLDSGSNMIVNTVAINAFVSQRAKYENFALFYCLNEIA